MCAQEHGLNSANVLYGSGEQSECIGTGQLRRREEKMALTPIKLVGEPAFVLL